MLCLFRVTNNRRHNVNTKVEICVVCTYIGRIFGIYIYMSYVYAYVIEGRVKYVFYPPPLFCPTKFVKSSDQCTEKKATAGEKILGSFFFKN